MATIKNTRKFSILLGDGATPTEVFLVACSFASEKGITFTRTFQETQLIDCAAPDNESWTERAGDSKSASLTGSGTLDTASLSVWRTWMDGSSKKNVRVVVDELLAAGGGWWAGAFVLESFSVTRSGKGWANFDATLLSDGVITWVPAAA